MKTLATIVVLLAVLLTFGAGQNPALGYEAGPGTTVPTQPLWLVQIRL